MAPGPLSEAELLRARIAQARRRRDGARSALDRLQAEAEATSGRSARGEAEVGGQVRIASCSEAPALQGQTAEVLSKDVKRGRCKVRLSSGEQRQMPIASLMPHGTSAAASCAEPLVSTQRLLLRSAVPHHGGGVPCELWPLVQSCLARVEVPEDTVLRLSSQLDAVARVGADDSPHRFGEIRSGRRVKISRPDPQYAALVEKMCTGLAWSILGRKDVTLQLDKVWGVIQKEGDYCPVQQHSCDGAPNGFVSILDVQMPAALSLENHERPSKGSYGFHDGLHNILWKSDRATDKNDLIHPGILQLELRTGFLYVFPQRFQHLTYPFEGPGERKWIAATVALRISPGER